MILEIKKREASFLLNIGANPNRLFEEHGGISAFHIAVGLENDLKFTKLFVNHQALVNLKYNLDYSINIAKIHKKVSTKKMFYLKLKK